MNSSSSRQQVSSKQTNPIPKANKRMASEADVNQSKSSKKASMSETEAPTSRKTAKNGSKKSSVRH